MRRRSARARCVVLAAASVVALAVLAVGPAGAVVPGGPASCRATGLRITFGSTGLDSSHVDAFLVLTNRTDAACRLDGAPTVRYVTARGATLGALARPVGGGRPVTLRPGGAAHARVRTSVPGVWNPTLCVARRAIGLRVAPPGASRATLLRFPETVCSGRRVPETTVTDVAAGPGPQPTSCLAPQLVVSLGGTSARHGTRRVTLVFRDPVLYTCSVHGFPIVRSVLGPAGDPVGPTASDAGAAAPTVWVQPFGGTARATLSITAVGAFPAASCASRRASGVEITPPGSGQPESFHLPHVVCTRRASTSVTAVVQGAVP